MTDWRMIRSIKAMTAVCTFLLLSCEKPPENNTKGVANLAENVSAANATIGGNEPTGNVSANSKPAPTPFPKLPKGAPLKKSTFSIGNATGFCDWVIPEKTKVDPGDGSTELRTDFDCVGPFDVQVPIKDINGNSEVVVARVARLRAIFVQKKWAGNDQSYAGFTQETDVLTDFSGTKFKWIIFPLEKDGKTIIDKYESPGVPIACSGTNPSAVEHNISEDSSKMSRVERVRFIAVRDGPDPKLCKRLAHGSQCKYDWQCIHACYPGPGDGEPKYCMASDANCAWPGSPGSMYSKVGRGGFVHNTTHKGRSVWCGIPAPGSRARWFYN